MLGKNTLRIGANEFALGMASDDYAEDGYLGPSSSYLNPFKARGSISFLDVGTAKTASGSGSFIASCAHPEVTAQQRMFLTSSGKVFTCDSTGTLTERGTDSTNTYLSLNSDMVEFNGNAYVTSTTDVMLVDTSSWTLDHDWWTNTMSKTGLGSTGYHPMLVYNSTLFIADNSRLHSYDGTTATYGHLALGADEYITALHIDPGSGMMMIAVTSALDQDATLNPRAYIYLYNGSEAYPRRKIPVEAMVTGFCSVGGRVFVGYGTKVGFWNGAGVDFLRDLTGVTRDRKYLPGKHQMTAWEDVLLVGSGVNVIAYGATSAGARGWFNMFQTVNGGLTRMVSYIGSGKFMIASGTGDIIYYFNTGASSGSIELYTRRFTFNRPINITSLTLVTSAFDDSPSLGAVYIYDDKGNAVQPTDSLIKNYASNSIQYIREFKFSLSTQSFQIYITTGGSSTLQIRTILVGYNVIE